MRIELAFDTIKFLGISGRVTFDGYVWPFWRIFSIDLKPLIKAGFSVWLDGVSRAFWLTNTTIDAFVGMDYKHVFTFVEAIHGAHFHAIHKFTFYAVFGDDVGHFIPLFQLLRRQLAERLIQCTHFLWRRYSIEFFVEQTCL
jgi:hypothetical protein